MTTRLLIDTMNHDPPGDSNKSWDRPAAPGYIIVMDSLPCTPIDLIAVDPARNIRRRWSLIAMHDLFGRVVIETSWGRIGRRGRHLTKSFSDADAALRYTRTLLARRRTAERRLGVGYVERRGACA